MQRWWRHTPKYFSFKYWLKWAFFFSLIKTSVSSGGSDEADVTVCALHTNKCVPFPLITILQAIFNFTSNAVYLMHPQTNSTLPAGCLWNRQLQHPNSKFQTAACFSGEINNSSAPRSSRLHLAEEPHLGGLTPAHCRPRTAPFTPIVIQMRQVPVVKGYAWHHYYEKHN